MFINLSNHKSSLWTEEQKTEGVKYGKLVDYPFPNIVPSCNDRDIAILADKIFDDIINQYGKNNVIHIMGEFTLSYALIKRFRNIGIKCVASCTERNVTEGENGEKIVRFNFVRYREYE